DRLRGIASEWAAAHDELETMQVVASSADELATATADSGGTVTDLVLAPGLRRHGSEVVATSILEATSDAVERANATGGAGLGLGRARGERPEEVRRRTRGRAGTRSGHRPWHQLTAHGYADAHGQGHRPD